MVSRDDIFYWNNYMVGIKLDNFSSPRYFLSGLKREAGTTNVKSLEQSCEIGVGKENPMNRRQTVSRRNESDFVEMEWLFYEKCTPTDVCVLFFFSLGAHSDL